MKQESILESKEKLVQHLEQKVTTIMLEKEEIIIQLKADLLVLQQNKEENDKNFN